MGLATFYLPRPERLSTAMVRQCYMQGIDAIPWTCQNSLDGNILTIRRNASESGNLFVPWHTQDRGQITLTTTCLRESNAAYHLPIELARGTVGRMRNQVATWQQSGLHVSEDVAARVETATRALCLAATSADNDEIAEEAADEAINVSLDAIELMMRQYSRFSLQRSGKRNVFLAANLGSHPGARFPSDLLGAINTAVVPFAWNEIEGSNNDASAECFAEQIRWCKKLGLRVCGGPLLNFGKNGLPDWLYLWEDDPEALESYMLDYVEATVKKYADKVTLWHAWSGINDCQAMKINEELRVRLAVASLERLRSFDPSTPVFVSFNQPFGEYLARKSLDLAPIQYADTLIRAELGVSGFGLEINLGYWPEGTLPRDVLEISRLVDRWTSLGLPLVLILTLPSAGLAEPDGERAIIEFGANESSVHSQAKLASEIIEVCLAKPAVQGVIWNQLADGDSNVFPHGGLYTSDAEAKPVLDQLRALKEHYLT